MNFGNLLSEQSNQLLTQAHLDFDYGILDSATRILVKQHTSEIKSLMRRTAQDIISIGQKLIEVKQQLGHGKFRNWLNVEFDWGVWTVTKFMQVAEKFESVNFTHLNIAASALYLLASPSTPEEARIEALERASLGENITSAKAKAIVSRHKEAVTFKPDKTATVDVPTKTVKCNLSTTVKPLDQHTSISKEEFSFELVKDAPDRIDEVEQKLSGKELETKTHSLQGLNFSPASNSTELTLASWVDVFASTQTIPDVVAFKIASGIKNLTPEQLALVIEASANNGLSDHHLEVLISAAQQALKQRRQPE